MAWQIFSTKTSPTPMSSLDTQSGNLAQWSIVDTTATGTNVITLTPSLSGYTAPAYVNYVSYRFAAANNSSGAVTLKVGSLAALNVYAADGITQMGSGNVVANQMYFVTYNSALNSSAGGWYLTPFGTSAGGVSNPVTLGEGGSGQVTAAAARGSSGFNIDQMTTTSANASYSILATDRVVATGTTAMTGGHTWTLPAANAINAGQRIWVLDLNGVTGTQTLTIARAGSDTINGATSVALTLAYSGYVLTSDGTSKWSAESFGGSVTAGGGISVSGSTVSINTNNSIGVGASAQLRNAGANAINNAATIAGSLMLVGYWSTTDVGAIWVDGSAPSGTWRNVSGVNLPAGNGNQAAIFIRTA